MQCAKSKRKVNLIRAQKLLVAAETGDIDLLKEMKKVRGISKAKNELTDNL